MMAFFPNLGSMPVDATQNVSVLLNDEQFFEGPAKDFKWQGNGSDVVKGWREMLPDEKLHSEHRLTLRKTRVMKETHL